MISPSSFYLTVPTQNSVFIEVATTKYHDFYKEVNMISISLCMIVKNEEEVLGECLESVVDVCDEIIIVDTGSTDITEEIAVKYTRNIYQFKWIDDFSAARNYAFSFATKNYILWLDADDILLKEDQEKLLELKESLDPKIDSVTMNYIISFDEYNNPLFYFRRNRLVKRERRFQWQGAVHEYLEVCGTILDSDIAVVHRKQDKEETDSNRNIAIYERRLKMGEIFTPRDLFYFANELKDHREFKRAIHFYHQFLDTKKGWIEDKIRANLYLADVYRELHQQEDEVDALLKTFTLDTPRPEACCRLGDIFQKRLSWPTAIFWYHCAINNDQTNPQAFINKIFSAWYPHLSLCICYWKMGDTEAAIKHNEIAGEIRPNDTRYLYNRDFFKRNISDKEGMK